MLRVWLFTVVLVILSLEIEKGCGRKLALPSEAGKSGLDGRNERVPMGQAKNGSDVGEDDFLG